MEYLAYIVIGFTGLQFAVSFINLLFKQNLKRGQSYNELVSVLIPARNEEKNIANLLSDLQNQDYKNIEIIVFDDQSADNTSNIVSSIAKTDNRIQLISSTTLPDGWLGKNYACHSLSQKAKGEYYLFLDADVHVYNDIVERALSHAKKNSLGLLSIFPRQEMKTLAEHFTVPLMNYILLTLLPLVLVRKSCFVSLSAANGQFMLFKSDVYENMHPHQTVRNKKVEDIEIARYYKKNRIALTCLANQHDVSCRMYSQYKEAISGFAKNVIMFFGRSYVLALLFWGVTTLGFLPIMSMFEFPGLIIYLSFMVVIRLSVSLASNQSFIKNSLYMAIQQLSLGVIVLKAIQYGHKKQHIWKGRNVS